MEHVVVMQLLGLAERGLAGVHEAGAEGALRLLQLLVRHAGKAEELHHYDMFHPSLAEINSDLDRVLAVTAQDVRRVAAKYLDPANAVVIIVKPATGGGAQ